MEKILTEQSRVTQVTGIARSGDYEYEATYTYDAVARQIGTLRVVVYRVADGQRQYSGQMTLGADGKRSMSYPETMTDALAPHVRMLDGIMQEAKEAVAAEPES